MYNEIGVGIHIGVTILNTMCSPCWRAGLVAACSKSRGGAFFQAAPMPSQLLLKTLGSNQEKGLALEGRFFTLPHIYIPVAAAGFRVQTQEA
jgi:hypothetical protein